MLCDAPEFLWYNVALAKRVEKSGLPVIDVAHDGHDWWTMFQFGVLRSKCRAAKETSKIEIKFIMIMRKSISRKTLDIHPRPFLEQLKVRW